jgi:formylglycine-generating enzyme required for sulfatase activity
MRRFLQTFSLLLLSLCVLAATPSAPADSLDGSKAGEAREVVGIKLRWCPAGSFKMGSPRDEPERRPGEDQVDVTLNHGFWMGQFEVTQGEWKRVMGALPGEVNDRAGIGDDFSLYNVNYAEAQALCAKLTELARATSALPEGWAFRLPTEAQWEYACRAGTTTATYAGDTIDSTQGNFQGDKPYNGAPVGPALNRATKVGTYPPNPWGLYDMVGNETEWCRDWAHARLPGGVDPDLSEVLGTPSQNGAMSRSRRGGGWTDPGWPQRSAFRQRFEPERRYDHIGMRASLSYFLSEGERK